MKHTIFTFCTILLFSVFALYACSNLGKGDLPADRLRSLPQPTYLGSTSGESDTPVDGAKIILKGIMRYFDVSKSDPDVIYALSSGKLMKSINAGEKWTEITSISKIVTVEIDRDNPNTVYAAQGG